MGGEGRLRDADGGANLEVGSVDENIVAVNHAPFITAWRGAQMILVVIDFVGAIPVLVLDGCALVPFLVFNVGVVVVMVLGNGYGCAAHKACGKDCEGKNCVKLFHWDLLQSLDARGTAGLCAFR